jgi:hypothetical protein
MHFFNLNIYLLETLSVASDQAYPSEDVEQLLTDAKIQLETLLRLYYLRHGFESHDIFLVNFLSFLAFMHLRSLKDTAPAEASNWHSGVVLMTQGIRDQARNMYLAEIVFRVLKASIGPESQHLLRYVSDIVDEQEDRNILFTERVHSDWALDIIGINEDPEKGRLENLVKTIDEFNLN